jgi:hypothetical protein
MMMKKLLLLFMLLSALNASSQVLPDSSSKSWEIDASVNMYFIPNDLLLMPVVSYDKGRLHLEARYNYEDLKTASLWGGYNFELGNKLKLEATPMLGLVFGQTDGIAPGIEFTLSYSKFYLYHETEYLFNFEDRYSNYYYQWSELGFSPTDWLNVGLTAQRTRVYQSSREVQKGLFAGGIFKALYITGYYFNPFDDNRLFVLTLGLNF